MALPKLVLTDSARRTLRTLYQAFVTLTILMPAIVTGINQLGAQIFGEASEHYGKLTAAGAFLTALVGIVARAILWLEERKLIPEWIKRTNQDQETVVVAKVDEAGVLQDVTMQTPPVEREGHPLPPFPEDDDLPGRHAADG